MDHIEECGIVDEGPMAAMAPPAPEMDKGNPVTVSVSMNASGKEHVADLLDMMKNAGLGDTGPAADKMMSPRMDMERLVGIMDDPKIPGKDDVPGDADVDDSSCMDDIDADEAYSAGDENAEGMVSNCCSAPVQDERDGTGRCSACGEGCEAVAEEVATEDMSGEGTYNVKVKGKNMASQNELARLAGMSGSSDTDVDEAGDYANEPDPQYGDMSDAIPDGNDLNRKKKSYAATQDGDNPMAVESDDNYVGAVEYHDGTTIYPKIGDTVELFYSDYTDSDDEADHKPNAVGKIVGKGKRDDEAFIIKWKDNTTGNIEQDEFSAADEFYILNKDRSDPSRIKGRKQGELPMPGGKTNRRNVRNTAGNEDMVETIKSQLLAALQEKKGKPDFPDIDNDGDTKEPMKKALKDKGSKPKKGEVPPQFKK